MATLLNTDANLEGKTLMATENGETVTGLKTFDRDPNPPFAVTAGSAKVDNLDADKLDGVEGTNYARWDGNGTPGGQIAFPATQSASSDANTLDDYEEGSFTPTVTGSTSGSGQAYDIQVGRYVKIGKLVHIQGRVRATTIGTITGTVRIGGLPFTAQNTTNAYSGAAIGYWESLAGNFTHVSGYVVPNTTHIELTGVSGDGGATSMATLAQANVANNTGFIFSATYEASA